MFPTPKSSAIKHPLHFFRVPWGLVTAGASLCRASQLVTFQEATSGWLLCSLERPSSAQLNGSETLRKRELCAVPRGLWPCLAAAVQKRQHKLLSGDVLLIVLPRRDS